MEKIYIKVAFIFLCALNLFGFVFAQENVLEKREVLNSEAEVDLKIFQIEINLEVLIKHANDVLNVLENKTNDTTEVQNLIVDFEEVFFEVKNLTGNLDLNEKVELYLLSKSKIKDLTIKFKNISKNFLNEDERKILRSNYKEIKKEVFGERRVEFQALRKNFLFERIQKIEMKLNLSDNLSLSFLNGNLNFKEVKKEIRKFVRDLPENERKEFLKNLKKPHNKKIGKRKIRRDNNTGTNELRNRFLNGEVKQILKEKFGIETKDEIEEFVKEVSQNNSILDDYYQNLTGEEKEKIQKFFFRNNLEDDNHGARDGSRGRENRPRRGHLE